MFFYYSCGDVAANIADNWTVQRQNEYAFSSVACDQTIGKTLNWLVVLCRCLEIPFNIAVSG
jgi:hypothetical protein